MNYRTSGESQLSNTIGRQSMKEIYDQDADLVPFNSPCPWCGDSTLISTRRSYSEYSRKLVKPRMRWWQFWRPLIPYFKVKCYQCKGNFREMTTLK